MSSGCLSHQFCLWGWGVKKFHRTNWRDKLLLLSSFTARSASFDDSLKPQQDVKHQSPYLREFVNRLNLQTATTNATKDETHNPAPFWSPRHVGHNGIAFADETNAFDRRNGAEVAFHRAFGCVEVEAAHEDRRHCRYCEELKGPTVVGKGKLPLAVQISKHVAP